MASLVAQRLKRLLAMWETWVQSLGREDPLEKEMATHSNILAWRIPWMEELGGLQSTGSKRVGNDCALHFHFLFLALAYLQGTECCFFRISFVYLRGIDFGYCSFCLFSFCFSLQIDFISGRQFPLHMLLLL